MSETGLYIESHGGERVALPVAGKLILGSDADRAGFVVTGQGVEGAHCAIGRVKNGGWAIKDLGSQFGTFVNGKKISSARLDAGDRIVLGSASLSVIDPARPTAAPPTPPATPAPSAAGEAAPTAVETVQAALPERRVGGFLIERVLGRGGMGEVLLAVQESLNRHVALKVLSAELAADRAFVLSFHSEARAAAALNHPNVVVVHDVGEKDDQHFLVMEFMPGGSLEDRVARDGLIPWREVLDILHDAASGLSYAEAQGIVHRDIKPANLMVAGSGVVKIADLGLATPVADQGAGDQAEGRKTYGTPHFISPEQALGSAVDHRSDLYSLGATAYRLLTGRTPFSGDTAKVIVRARFQSAPVPMREIVPAIPAEVDALVLRLMEREPRDRFPTADSLLREVDRIRLLADHGAPASPGGAAKPGKPRGILVLTAIAALGVAFVGVQLLGDGTEPSAASTSDSRADTGDTRTPGNLPDDGEFFGDETSNGAAAAMDEERGLRMLELQAELALRDIPAEYSSDDRLEALREIVSRFGPTNVAKDAQDEIDRITSASIDARVRTARREREIRDAVTRMERAAGWPPDDEVAVPQVADYLRRVADYQVSVVIATDPEFIAKRAELVESMVALTEERANDGFARADALAEKGSFDEVRLLLDEIVPRLWLPDPRDEDPESLARLRKLLTVANERAARLEGDQDTYRIELIAEDRRMLSETIGPASTLLVDLKELRLEPLTARLAEMVDSLRTRDAKAAAIRIHSRVVRARSALELLVTTFRDGEWRRKTVSVPNGRRATPRDVVGVEAGGIVVSAESGAELIPWTRFTSSPVGFASLFRGRLTRSYTASEHEAILSVLTLAAIDQALAPAILALAPSARNVFDPTSAAAMKSAFDGVDAWTDGMGPQNLQLAVDTLAELGREREATKLLSDALSASQLDEWTRSVSTIEYLLTGFANTLCVIAISDGSFHADLATPVVEVTPEQQAREDASAPTAADAPASTQSGSSKNE